MSTNYRGTKVASAVAAAVAATVAGMALLSVTNLAQAHGGAADPDVLLAQKTNAAVKKPNIPAQVVADPLKAMVPAAAPVTRHVELAAQMNLFEGKSTLMRLPSAATRLSVGDSRIADVILLNPSEVYMLGKAAGSTNLIIWDKNNDATIIDISVGIDTVALRSRIDQLLPSEKGIILTTAADTVIISGTVSDVVKADQIMSIANAYVQRSSRSGSSAGGSSAGGASAGAAPASGGGGGASAAPKVVNMMSVSAPQQVMLEVKVAEVSKSLTDQIGVSAGFTRTLGGWTTALFSNLLTNTASSLSGTNNRNGDKLNADAQRKDGLVKVLAEPNIMAISGQDASFLAGGKIFIPVSQDSTNGSTKITLEEKEFGVGVKFTPTVLEGGRINLKVLSEVSDLNKDGIGISASGISGTAILPSFTTRRASTTVQLFDGQSFAIGGLIKHNVTTNIKALPGLGEVPVLGTAAISRTTRLSWSSSSRRIWSNPCLQITNYQPMGTYNPTALSFSWEARWKAHSRLPQRNPPHQPLV
jgi:pilus assembly protein CpaC